MPVISNDSQIARYLSASPRVGNYLTTKGRSIPDHIMRTMERRANRPRNVRGSSEGSDNPMQLYGSMLREAQFGTSQTSSESLIYEPYLNPLIDKQHLEFPADRQRQNQRFWDYFLHDPLLSAGIRLLVEFPLSNFKLVHDDPELEDLYNEIGEELDLLNLVLNMGIQYYVLGEVLPFGFVDNPQSPRVWTDFILLNPDWAIIHRHPVARPVGKGSFGKYSILYAFYKEPGLRKIINDGPHSKATSDLFRQIPIDILNSVKSREYVKLPDVQCSYFPRIGNYFTGRGESIIKSCILSMMYRDKLRAGQYCLPAGTEVLTDCGWKKIEQTTTEDTVATYNKNTNELEYHKPLETVSFDYEGNLLHFKNLKVDFTCTPNHRMLVETTTGTWKVKQAKDVKHTNRVKAAVEWRGVEPPQIVKIGDHEIPIYTYLEYAGYYLAEGFSKYYRFKRGSCFITSISQKAGTESYNVMKSCFESMPIKFKEYVSNGYANFNVHGKDIQHHMAENFGESCYLKKIPHWIKQLPPAYMEILLKAACLGDGTVRQLVHGMGMKYATVSKQLADDMQEMAWKCGYYACIYENKCDTNLGNRPIYKVSWNMSSRLNRGIWLKREEIVGDHRLHKKDCPDWRVEEPYNGKVYCLVVPNGFFVTRQNGKISIHGNSIVDRHITPTEFYMVGETGQPATADELDALDNALQGIWNGPNKALVWHHALKIQFEGATGRILPLQPEFQYVEQQVLTALGLSRAFLYGEGPCHDVTSQVLTENGWKNYDDVLEGERIASFDTKTGRLIYEMPLERHKWHYKGDMVHFNTQRIDVCVTPDHECFIKKDGVWQKKQAQDVKTHSKMICHVEWTDGDFVPHFNILGRIVPSEIWMEFLGYFLTEGSMIYDPKGMEKSRLKGKKSGNVYQVRLTQCSGPVYERIKFVLDSLGLKYSVYLKGKYKNNKSDCYEFVICSKEFCDFLMKEFDGNRKAAEKRIPRKYLMLRKPLLRVLYDAMMAGDGNCRLQGKNKDQEYWTYTTVSEGLADDFMELAFKCGKAPVKSFDKIIWRVFISEDSRGGHREPEISRGKHIKKIFYDNYVWCFRVPSGAFITRRNGKIGQNFNTYANASIALEVLIARFITFRQSLEQLLLKQIFTPMCIWNGLYKECKPSGLSKYKFMKRKRSLDLPRIKWDKENLREDRDKINMLSNFAKEGSIPWEIVWKSLNLDPKEMTKKLKEQLKDMPGAANILAGSKMGKGLPGEMPPVGGGGGGGGGGAGEMPSDLPTPAESMPDGGLGEVVPPESHEEPTLPTSNV